jgi:hypothetical protein
LEKKRSLKRCLAALGAENVFEAALPVAAIDMFTDLISQSISRIVFLVIHKKLLYLMHKRRLHKILNGTKIYC